MSVELRPMKKIFYLALLFPLMLVVLDQNVCRYALVRLPGDFWLKREKAAILGTLKTYNSILSDFYASGGVPSLLDEFPATKAIKHGIFRDLGYIKSAEKILVYDMAETIPVEVRITAPGQAEAVVFESWNYMYQRVADRKPLTLPKGMGHGFKYRLAREKGKWLVQGWDPVDIEEPKKKPEFYF